MALKSSSIDPDVDMAAGRMDGLKGSDVFLRFFWVVCVRAWGG